MKIKYDQKRGEKIALRSVKIFEKRYREIEGDSPIQEYIYFYRRETLVAAKWYSNVTIFDLKDGGLFRVLPTASEFPKIMEAFLQTSPNYPTIKACIKEFLFKSNWLATGRFIELNSWDLWRKDGQGLFDRLIKEKIWIYPYVSKEGVLDLRFSPKEIRGVPLK